jgi:small-conductance mechanosensitive channel
MMYKRFFVVCLMLCGCVHAGYFEHFFKIPAGIVTGDRQARNGAVVIVSDYEEKKQLLLSLEEELGQLEEKLQGREDEHKKHMQELDRELGVMSASRAKAASSELDFLSKKETLLNETKQAMSDYMRNMRQAMHYLKKHIEVLRQYIDDPTFSEKRIAEKAAYDFAEYQAVAQRLLFAEAEYNRLRDDKKKFEDELSKVSSNLDVLNQDLKQKEKGQQSFIASQRPDEDPDSFRYKSQLLDIEITVLRKKIESVEQKRVELQYEIDLVTSQLFVAKKDLELLKKDIARVDRKLWVSDTDITDFQKTIEAKRQETAKRKDAHTREMNTLISQRDSAQKAFEERNDALPTPIKDVRRLSEWMVEPASVGNEEGFYGAASAHDQWQSVERQLKLAFAKQDLNVWQLSSLELQLEVMKTWLTITQRHLLGDETNRQEKLAFFTTKRNEVERELQSLRDKDAEIALFMSVGSRALSQIKQRRESLVADRARVVKAYGDAAYKRMLEYLDKSQAQINKQIELNGQIIKEYAATRSILTDMDQHLRMVIAKLEAIGGIWQRAAGAITWEGIKSTLPDVKFFGEDVFDIVFNIHTREIGAWFHDTVSTLSTMLNMLFLLLVIAVLYFLFVIIFPLLSKLLVKKQKMYGWQVFVNFVATILQFLHDYLLGITVWATLLLLIHYDFIFDVGVRAKVIFYLLSIPYLCYIARAFILFYLEHNKQFMSEAFRARLSKVLQFFLFSTIIIFFFREAFILTTYGHSEVPNILLAVYSIIVRASLVFLIMTKELIIDALPSSGAVWSFVKEQIDYYYSVFLVVLIALIVMSDPFVGYGRLVSVVLQGAFWTVLILVVFWWMQRALKFYSTHIFFVRVTETPKERFSYAKTWYGLFIVLSFAVLISATVLLLAAAWGYPVSFERIYDALNFEIVPVHGDLPGETISITPLSLLILIAFIFGGFFVSSVFNRYVLDRIYNLLQVDMGVQNTVSRISGYIIVIIVVIVGLQRVGLGNWIPYALTFLAVGFAFAVKGPADDFIAYFIILVERSIKIGDYIRLDSAGSETSGVVRKITPRSVILRKKNSYNIVVPNSKITKSYILNWNYTRGYIAFEDIIVVVAYGADPMKVKDIFFKILDGNSAVLKSPQAIVRINNFALNGYEFMVRGYLGSSNVLNQWDISSDIRFAIVAAFKEHNIEIAVPIRSLRMGPIEIKK